MPAPFAVTNDYEKNPAGLSRFFEIWRTVVDLQE